MVVDITIFKIDININNIQYRLCQTVNITDISHKIVTKYVFQCRLNTICISVYALLSINYKLRTVVS